MEETAPISEFSICNLLTWVILVFFITLPMAAPMRLKAAIFTEWQLTCSVLPGSGAATTSVTVPVPEIPRVDCLRHTRGFVYIT